MKKACRGKTYRDHSNKDLDTKWGHMACVFYGFATINKCRVFLSGQFMQLTPNEIRARAYQFANDWQGETRERGEAQTFWNDLLKVFGVDRRRVASFEKHAERFAKNAGFIDLFWPGLLIAEHKSAGKNLDQASTQAFEYLHGLGDGELPQYIVVSDFARFKLFNLSTSPMEEIEFPLEALPANIHHLQFLAGYKTREYKDEDPINIEAAEKLGKLYDALKDNGYDEHSLKVFLVRLMFVLFAEDTGIFEKDWFRWCIENKTREDGSDTGRFINEVFAMLDSPEGQRQKNVDEDLLQFRYINGSLFSENLRAPSFDTKARNSLLALCAIDWNQVSPAIFGSLFQSALDEKERRKLGAHYTSEKNILKVLKSLFLDELTAELNSILASRSTRQKVQLEAFQVKLRGLTFLDPACGCGNFLVIAYREVRLLETRAIKAIEAIKADKSGGQLRADTALRSLVDVDQFYGIEVDEYPVHIARVALWLTDHQMNMRLAEATGLHHLRLPLKAEPHITQANALRMDWNDLIPASQLSYILGNPPFIGKNYLDDEQKKDIQLVLKDLPKRGQCDYVSCWYVKALQYIQGTQIPCAFVSTNSITQGQQVAALWPYLLQHGLTLHFAHRTFKWTNEARGNAAVFVVILGFGVIAPKQPLLYHYDNLGGEPIEIAAKQINPYLIDFDPVIIPERTNPLCDVPPMVNGNKPADGGHLILTANEKEAFVKQWPDAEALIKPLIGAEEFINGWHRYCIWLHEVSPSQYRHIKGVMDRIEAVRRFRLESTKPATRRDANRPAVFAEIRQSSGAFVVVPEVSSERRLYLPTDYLTADTIVTNKIQMLPDATLFHFGVLNSMMHMAWMRVVCGRLKSDYDYSSKMVYNNFPWPANPSKTLMDRVEACAQAVLDARQPYLDSGNTLADLYDPNAMPPNLLKAHQALDKAVDACYGRKTFATELERVTFLFERYQALVSGGQAKVL